MKKILRFTAAVLAGVLTVSAAAFPGGAVTFGSTDSNTAVAGASASLKNFLEGGNGSAADIAAVLSRVFTVAETPSETPDESAPETVAVETEAPIEEDTGDITYEEPVIGVANVQGVLNVRKEQTALSDIVEFAVRGTEIEVLGESVVNHAKWYRVRVNGTEGYVAGNFVVFGENADKMRQIVEREAESLPEGFEITEDLSSIDPYVAEKLQKLAKEINFVLKVDYKNYIDQGDFTSTYSVLIYLLELFQEVDELANEYGVTDLFNRVEKNIGIVEINRQKLSEATGYSEEDFVAMITDANERAAEAQRQADQAAADAAAAAAAYEQAQAAAAAAADEEARRVAQEQAAAAQAAADQAAAAAAQQQAAADAAAAQAAEAQQQMDAAAAQGADNPTGRAIADYAASWVGRINYVYGGNDFREGGGVDCSHFTYNVYLNMGLVGGYTPSYGQRGWGSPVSIDQIQPGDLVCYDGHVAIYYGNGLIVHAPRPGSMIEIGNMYSHPVVAVRRLY
jgi:cell wall-associated NlpC family hydrolase